MMTKAGHYQREEHGSVQICIFFDNRVTSIVSMQNIYDHRSFPNICVITFICTRITYCKRNQALFILCYRRKKMLCNILLRQYQFKLQSNFFCVIGMITRRNKTDEKAIKYRDNFEKNHTFILQKIK